MSPKDWVQLALFAVTIMVSLVGLYFSIKNRKQATKSVEAKTNLDEAQQASIVKQLADSTEEMYLKRIASFKDDIRLQREEITECRQTCKEYNQFKDFFFNYHQPWDRRVSELLKRHGIKVETPPSWAKFKENQDA